MFSMVPNPSKSFLQYYIRPRPDLYGPFWICVTLVFSIAISGNMADFLQKSFQATEDHPIKWHYDFHKVSYFFILNKCYFKKLMDKMVAVWVNSAQLAVCASKNRETKIGSKIKCSSQAD